MHSGKINLKQVANFELCFLDASGLKLNALRWVLGSMHINWEPIYSKSLKSSNMKNLLCVIVSFKCCSKVDGA